MSYVETIEPLRHRNVGEIAANLAGATDVFRRFGIDFCCHGNVPLEEAAQARAVDFEALQDALLALDGGEELPALPEDTAELIDHILSRYHEVHRRQVPELITLSRRVEQVHAEKNGVPAGLADMLQHALGELEVHMRKEELILFPAMRRQGSGPLDGPIAQMRDDHVDHGELLQSIAELTGDFTVPEGACATWRALYVGAAQFRDDLIDHIHIENNILFPRFESGAATR
ncbi:iron-sulfur cluster repair di-iron protein [Sphingosinicella rhizophila]|uniref:Iron-sulfur cluster repair di-iron protein n=1 Tax=Sphingosinicella rhizophila TaxID=3050082 RepID=A0ABU3Q929_9SPHN|nr:iron-sulfur cluster repair di-iron protein [Sphingosinicella sp. GR2756]MDT9599913.1 iron-sulfur cluster repair di-iron protein [Sphingosinicella sp. GR2756]